MGSVSSHITLEFLVIILSGVMHKSGSRNIHIVAVLLLVVIMVLLDLNSLELDYGFIYT